MSSGTTHAKPPIIGILTDFGYLDGYVASMKAALLRHCPNANLIDITHSIEPGDIRRGSWVLGTCAGDFPPGCWFLAVVDPGVGTDRKAIAIQIGPHFFVLPDNGLISHTRLRLGPPSRIHRIDPTRCLGNQPVSPTFHGRDLFAPVLGMLASGSIQLEDVGPPMSQPILIKIPTPSLKDTGEAEGSVDAIDRFGNLITNIPDHWAKHFTQTTTSVRIANWNLPLLSTFGNAPPQTGLAYWGSSGFLEIALNRGNAAQEWSIGIDTPVQIRRRT